MTRRPEMFVLGVLLATTVGCTGLKPVEGPTARLRIVILPATEDYPKPEKKPRSVDTKTKPGDNPGVVASETPRDKRFREALKSKLSVHLVKKLRVLEAAVTVNEDDSSGQSELRERADLVIQPILTRRPKLSVSASVSDLVTSTLLWFTTYFVGPFIDDYEYGFGSLEVTFEFASGGSIGVPFHEESMRPAPVKLDFLDRTNYLSWQMAGTLILPPCIWPSNEEEELEKLTDSATTALARGLTQFLKHEFEEEALNRGEGSMALEAVLDGTKLTITGRVRSRKQKIDNLSAVVNGELLTLSQREFKNETKRGTHSVEVHTSATLSAEQAKFIAEENGEIRVRARAESVFSRTLLKSVAKSAGK